MYTMHNRVIQKLASDIASSATADELYGALASAAARLGFDHFALAYDRRGAPVRLRAVVKATAPTISAAWNMPTGTCL